MSFLGLRKVLDETEATPPPPTLTSVHFLHAPECEQVAERLLDRQVRFC